MNLNNETLAVAVEAMADASGMRFGSDTMKGIGKGVTP